MNYKMKGFSGFKNSPLKQNGHTPPLSTEGEPLPGSKEYKKLMKNKTEVDPNTKALFDSLRKRQMEDIQKGKKEWEEGEKGGPNFLSPLKQSSVLDPESGIPWASKKDYPKKPNLVNLGKTNYMKVDISTKEGKDIVTRYKNTPTIRSSDPSRVTKPKRVNVTTGFGSEADKRMTSLVNKRTSVAKVSKKPVSKLGGVAKTFSNVPKQFAKKGILKSLGKIGSKLIPGLGTAITAYDVGKYMYKNPGTSKKITGTSMKSMK